MKFALGHVDEYLFNALRLVLSSLTLAALIGFQSLTQRAGSGNVARTIPDVPAIRYWVSVVVFALFTGFAYQLLFLVGINMTSAGNTALIMSAIPAWTAVLALILLGERLSARSWTGLLVALAGVVIVTLSNGTTVSFWLTDWKPDCVGCGVFVGFRIRYQSTNHEVRTAVDAGILGCHPLRAVASAGGR